MSTLSIESHSIERIPDAERHGRAAGLFAVWFAANVQITTVVTGALAVLVGLPLPWALAALALGNLLGGTVMALHSVQGPQLGIPQMIQSRAQFGFHGAILPLLLVLLMYVGFFASTGVLGAQALGAWSGLPMVPAIVVLAALCALVAVVGYRLVHALARLVSALAAAGFLVLSVLLLRHGGFAAAWHGGGFGFGSFLLAVAIAATWQITFAPYVADYSRYLPARVSPGATFWWTYAGSVVGTLWMMAFGAGAAAVARNAFAAAPVDFVVGLAPPGWHGPYYALILLGVLAINTLNLYGAFMSAAATLSALVAMRIGPGARLTFVLAIAAAGALVAALGYRHFVENFENFILFLAYFLIPWTAINLTDYYWVRRGRYDLPSIFDPDGLYGRWNGPALGAYALGILVEIPFMSTSFYTGPLVARLGGADISWLLGLLVAGGAYALAGGGIRRRERAWFAARERKPAAGAGAGAARG